MLWETLKNIWWLVGVLVAISVAIWRLAIKTNQSKVELSKVAENKKEINALSGEIAEIKHDVSEIKGNVDKQASDTSAMLSLLQAITIALHDKDCNIGPARDRFNDYLAKR